MFCCVNNLFSCNLVKLQAEREARDTGEKGQQFRVALEIDMTSEPGIKGQVALNLGE
jgi:hypothetical protein